LLLIGREPGHGPMLTPGLAGIAPTPDDEQASRQADTRRSCPAGADARRAVVD
jgi:hypothetical protein